LHEEKRIAGLMARKRIAKAQIRPVQRGIFAQLRFYLKAFDL